MHMYLTMHKYNMMPKYMVMLGCRVMLGYLESLGFMATLGSMIMQRYVEILISLVILGCLAEPRCLVKLGYLVSQQAEKEENSYD